MYHSLTIEQIFVKLKTSKNGLSNSEARLRLETYGENIIKVTKSVSALKIFVSQFTNIVVGILIAAFLISFVLKEYINAIVIGVILILNAILGFMQEYKAERAIEALRRLASLKAKVIRDGKLQEINSKYLVPGDIIVLETGEKIDCDARLVEVFNLETQEAVLTGESTPIRKDPDVLLEKTQTADMKNMVFSGTTVVNGRGKAIVTATGMTTELGKIATFIQEEKEKLTPLQVQFKKLGHFLGSLVIAICILIFITGYLKNMPIFDIFFVAISIAVAAIPEGLPAVVTISLAIGIQRMIKKNVLVRKLSSVETLGSTTVICTDKTGTLTHNEMTVRKLYTNHKIIEVTGSGYAPVGSFLFQNKAVKVNDIKLLLQIGALNNDAVLTRDNKIIGDPTEGALIVSAAKAGLTKDSLEKLYTRIDEIGFDSKRKRMATIHKSLKENLAFVKGAPDIMMHLCTRIYDNGKIRKLTAKDKKLILNANEQFATKALRVLAFAYKPLRNNERASSNTEKDLIFVGLQGMIDPPRVEVFDSIKKCKFSGIRIIMVTGDHKLTAQAIATELGIEGKVITGEELDNKNIELDKIIDEYSIFARTNPYHKSKIIDALRKKGHIIAMTGDGINDAPALKKADIGVAMGISGTDVAKEASHMVLLNDNFTSIVDAVEEGRGIYDNIKKYFAFLISGNIGEVMIVFLTILLGLPLPLTAIQILLINLVTDGLPAIALSADPYEPHAMTRKPRPRSERIYKGLSAFIVYYPILMTISAMLIFYFLYSQSHDLIKAQTATFLTVASFEMYQAFASRSVRYPAFKVGIFKNRWLILAVLSSFIITMVVIYLPFFNKVFGTVPLNIFEFVTILIISSLGFIYLELYKYIKSRNIEINV